MLPIALKRILLIAVVASAARPCFAGARHFTFLYEAPTSPPGSYELENYATSKWLDGRFRDVDFRHELEIGITDHLQASVYVANWNYSDEERRTRYQSASLELIHNLSNPAADPIGISLYQEFSTGRRLLESETKLIAQKNFGPVILAYNFTVEAVWTGEALAGREGELQQALGACYELQPRISVGVELVHELVLPSWRSDNAGHNFFAGPNISYRGDGWFATITGLRQVTSTEDEPDYQVRLIFGFTL